MANVEVTEEDRTRLARAAGGKYGSVTRSWRVGANEKPAVLGICSQVGIVLSDDDTIRPAYRKVDTRVAASGAIRALHTSSTSTSVDFGDAAAAAEFDAAWDKVGTGTSPQSWRGGLAFLCSLLLVLAGVVLIAGVSDAVVLFAHSRKGLVSDGYGGTEVGRVHPQAALGFAVLIGSVVSAAVLAWCGVVGNYLIQRLEPAPPQPERQAPSA